MQRPWSRNELRVLEGDRGDWRGWRVHKEDEGQEVRGTGFFFFSSSCGMRALSSPTRD